MLSCLLAAGQLSAQVSISSGNTYTENFDALGSASATWADNSTLPGWYASLTNVTSGVVGPYTTAYAVSTGGGSGFNSSSTLYAWGLSGSSERALGGSPATASQGMLGWRLANGGTSAITNLSLSYYGEQWRRDNGTSTISVSYQVFPTGGGSLSTLGGWTAAPASLTFATLTTGTAGAMDGNAATNRAWRTATFSGLNLPPGGEIWFKWALVKVNGNNLPQGIDDARVAVNLGAPPIISTIPGITVMTAQTSTNANFTVTDTEDGAPAGTPTVVSSSNENIVPSNSVLFGGSGSNRFVYVSLAGAVGTAVITIQIVDSANNPAQQSFTVTVLPLDYPPNISTPGPTNTMVNTAATVPFTVSDVETPATDLVVTGQIAAYSVNILSNLTFSGSGSNRSVTVEPMPGADGVGVVTLSVMDSNNTTVSTSFAVMVRPASQVVFIEHFDYAPNVKLFTYSAGLWVRRNSSAGDVNLLTAPSGLSGYVRPKSSADDGAARLVGAPYRPGTGALLYTTFTATWFDLGGSDALVTNSNGAFVHLANNSSATSALFAKVATTTNDVPEGSFRLALYDLNNQYQTNGAVDIPEPLPASGPYTVVVRYDVDSGKSMMWVNATSEADPAASSQDQATPENINYVGLRQDLGSGYIYVDDLKVVLAVKPNITSISPPAGGNVDIYFSTGPGDSPTSFGVVRAASAAGTYDDVAATITSVGVNAFKATVGAPGTQQYYRIKRLPMAF
jgi:hypothetical protein